MLLRPTILRPSSNLSPQATQLTRRNNRSHRRKRTNNLKLPTIPLHRLRVAFTPSNFPTTVAKGQAYCLAVSTRQRAYNWKGSKAPLTSMEQRVRQLQPICRAKILQLLLHNGSVLCITLLHSAFSPLANRLPHRVIRRQFSHDLAQLTRANSCAPGRKRASTRTTRAVLRRLAGRNRNSCT